MSQASYNVPTGGSFSMVTFAGLMNGAYNALGSNNSGASAPANGPGNAAQEFQSWFNTSNVNFPVYNFFDGVNWDRVGTMDVANSNWLPKEGGGTATLASAATTDIGSSPQTFITISGTTTITSLGSNAKPGEERRLHFAGSLQITYNASLIQTPGAVNIITQADDTCIAIFINPQWYIFSYTRAAAATGFSLPTGSVFWQPQKNNAITGAVRCNALTIGNASSGATELASATTINLFTFLYNNLSNSICPVSGGRTGNAVNDFNNNKNIGLPDLRGMTLAGLDDMGNSAASRLTSATMSPNGTTAMATGGAQTVTLAAGNIPALSFSGTSQTWNINQGSCVSGATSSNVALSPGAFSIPLLGSIGTLTVTVTPAGTANSGSANTAVTVMQPTSLGTWYITL